MCKCQLEQEERARIDAIKEEERKKATEAIERWKENQKLQPTSIEEEKVASNSNVNQYEDTNMSATKADLEVGEYQEPLPKPATKKLAPYNKQRTNGTTVNFYGLTRYKIKGIGRK